MKGKRQADRRPLPPAEGRTLLEAYGEYLGKLAALRAVTQCGSTWNADRAEPGYLGTRCDLTTGHDGEHRARVPGTSVVVEW